MKHTCLSHDSGPLVLCHVTKQKLKNKTKTNKNETKATENHGTKTQNQKIGLDFGLLLGPNPNYYKQTNNQLAGKQTNKANALDNSVTVILI